MFSLSGLFTAARWTTETNGMTSDNATNRMTSEDSGSHMTSEDPCWDRSLPRTLSREVIERRRRSFGITTCCCSPKLRSSKSKNKKKSKENSRLKSEEGASVSDIGSYNSDMSLKNGFTEKEKMDLSQAFGLFDKNHDGKISSDELASVIKLLRFNISDSEIEEMIRIVDKNENGFVDYDEYLSLMRRFSKSTPARDVDEKTLEAFRVFDLDGNGFIDRHELQCVMKTLGENVSEDDIKEMFTEADLNGDGKIDYKEFSRLLSQLS